ncbi:hypothetical protein P154DRAFT_570539 [Amniculicola lignicola CBS 123094]|uniref:Uncharacterized protein n=1 Tax=Amniculicola lignicola CBS 123094 TaxID=1392246 RepID=A0A6A5WW23_9PLEO|nr:hypothetical protein P154DRAFT_570539 [Amniculicola lignicola CBS 123094]
MFFYLLRLFDMNRAHPNGLTAKSHPLYHLRLATIIIGLIGFALNFIAASASYDVPWEIPPFPVSIILEAISFLYCFHDLAAYAAAKASLTIIQLSIPPPATSSDVSVSRTTRTTDEPKWPTKFQIVVDFLLALFFQLLFWFELIYIISGTPSYYYGGGRETVESYANLANLLLSVLHGIVCWKEIIAKKQQSWLRKHNQEPCDSCGHVKAIAGDGGQTNGTHNGPSLFGHIGHGKITMPRWARGPNATVESDDEETNVGHTRRRGQLHEQASLLVTPDESATEIGGPSTYGTLDKSTDSIGSIPETVVKKKDKGKKRMVEVDE